ncbi:MFS general substrate transporter [Coprinopsis marcescibilis]|uniref:MFS general substrate transporter n=1 Tax=Coprinopsis marcescibilis TaxID=230819 RepID=A0A5C3KMZ1_COPMA|nr:MFS general substrate transporter [Coprinopsis marcescibilis]
MTTNNDQKTATPSTVANDSESPQASLTPQNVSDSKISTDEKQVETTSKEAPSSQESEHPPRTPKQRRLARIQFLTLCWCLFILGWNDGTTGPILPRIGQVYGVGFTVVSLVFVLSCAGFIIGALLNMWLSDKLGLGKVTRNVLAGAFLQIITYAVQAPAPPFPAFVAVNILNGIGLALQASDAQANGFVGALSKNSESKMGVLHAAYGLGAFAAPLVSTQFAQMPRWSFHYLVSLGLAISNTVLVCCVFRFRPQDECFKDAGEYIVPRGTSDSEHSNFRQVMTNKTVHFLAFFILIYVGVEVTIGGWIVTFIIDVRNGGPSSGYISAGFFGGLTLGRVVLLWVNKTRVGERNVLYLYALLSLGLEFVVWFVPSLVGNAVAVAFIGLFLGPMYPIAMNHASRVLPRWLLTSSIGWIAGFGQAGSAVIPFMTGAISSKHGIQSLHPLLVSMMGLMVILWFLIPNQQR